MMFELASLKIGGWYSAVRVAKQRRIAGVGTAVRSATPVEARALARRNDDILGNRLHQICSFFF